MKTGNAERRRGGYHLIYIIILPYEEKPVNTVNSGDPGLADDPEIAVTLLPPLLKRLLALGLLQ
jgi:hypothetical protein